MTSPFPHVYEVDLEHNKQGDGLLTVPGDQLEIIGGVPVQFGGRKGVWSPEALLLAAVDLCLMTTFKALAKKNNLDLHTYHSRCKGILDKTSDGIVFTGIELTVTLDSSDNALGEVLLSKAKKYCIISNALKTTPTLLVKTPGRQEASI